MRNVLTVLLNALEDSVREHDRLKQSVSEPGEHRHEINEAVAEIQEFRDAILLIASKR